MYMVFSDFYPPLPENTFSIKNYVRYKLLQENFWNNT